MIQFGNMDQGRQVGGAEEWQGEGERMEDKGEEDQERWSLMR